MNRISVSKNNYDQDCYGQGKLDFIQGQGKVREFYLKVAIDFFIRCFRIDKAILF